MIELCKIWKQYVFMFIFTCQKTWWEREGSWFICKGNDLWSNLGARSSIQVSHMSTGAAGTELPGSSLLPPKVAISRKLESGATAGNGIPLLSYGHRIPNSLLTNKPNGIPLLWNVYLVFLYILSKRNTLKSVKIVACTEGEKE